MKPTNKQALNQKLQVLIIFASISFAVSSDVPFEGFDGCRCAVDPEQLPEVVNGTALLAAYDPNVHLETYGYGCQTHDNVTTPCTTPVVIEGCEGLAPVPDRCVSEGAQSHCQNSWCYVLNSTQCSVETHTSFIFPEGRVYSYAACGDLDTFSGDSRPDLLRGATLRVGIRSNTGGWKGSYHPLGNANPVARDDQWDGPVLDFINMVAEQAGFTINYTNPPDWVLEQAGSSSSFTQCAYATALGYLDFCIGSFSITAERAKMVSFFVVETKPIYLIVRQTDMTVWDRVMRVFDPFEFEVWCVTFAVLIGLSFTLMMQESVHEYLEGMRLRPRPGHEEVLHNVYLGFRSYTDQAVIHEVLSWGGRVTSLGFGAFLLLSLAMYTANLTTILVTSSNGREFNNMEEVLSKGASVCIIRQSASAVKGKFSSIRLAVDEDGVEGLKSRSDMFIFMDEGKCDAGLAYLEDIVAEHAQGQACNYVTVGLPPMHGYNGFPIGDDIRLQAISSTAQDLINNGKWDEVKDNRYPKAACGSSSADSDERIGFNLEDMSGVFLVTVILAAIGITISSVQTMLKFRIRASELQETKDTRSSLGLDQDWSSIGGLDLNLRM